MDRSRGLQQDANRRQRLHWVACWNLPLLPALLMGRCPPLDVAQRLERPMGIRAMARGMVLAPPPIFRDPSGIWIFSTEGKVLLSYDNCINPVGQFHRHQSLPAG